MWKVKEKIGLRTNTTTPKEPVDSNLYVALKSASEKTSVKAASLQSDLVFEEIGHRIKNVGSQLVKKVGAIFQWNIMIGEKRVAQWTLDLKTGSGEMYQGTACKPPDTVFTLSEHDFMELARGKLKPQRAFLVGKVKVKGNIILGYKLETILKEYVKL